MQNQEQEIQRRERELDSTVRRPAEAEKFRLEKIAEANKNRLIMEAEATAEARILQGEAEAFSIEAKAKAEAEKMAKKADAWKEYKEAAMLDMMLEALPKVKNHPNRIGIYSNWKFNAYKKKIHHTFTKNGFL